MNNNINVKEEKDALDELRKFAGAASMAEKFRHGPSHGAGNHCAICFLAHCARQIVASNSLDQLDRDAVLSRVAPRDGERVAAPAASEILRPVAGSATPSPMTLVDDPAILLSMLRELKIVTPNMLRMAMLCAAACRRSPARRGAASRSQNRTPRR